MGSPKFILLLLMLLYAYILGAAVDAHILLIDASNYPHVSGYLSYHGIEGSADPLRASQLAITVDKTYKMLNLEVSPLSSGNIPMSILICVDASGSVTPQQLRNIKAALNDAIASTPQNTYVAIADFGKEFQVRCNFSNDVEYLSAAVNSISTQEGNTYLHYNIDKALKYIARQGRDGLSAIVIISDGKEQVKYDVVTQNDKDNIIKEALKQNITLNAIGYSLEKAPDYTILDYFSGKTDGQFMPITRPEMLKPAIISIVHLRKAIWQFSGDISELPGDGLDHQLFVQIDTGAGKLSASKKMTIPNNKKVYGVSFIAKVMQNKGLFYGILAGLLVLIGIIIRMLLSRRNKPESVDEQGARANVVRTEVSAKTSETRVDSAEPGYQSDQRSIKENKRRDHTEFLEPGSSLQEPHFTILKIEFNSGAYQGRSFTLEKNVARIGRADDNEIAIDEAVVSRHHAKIEYKGGVFIITDLGSANGTYVNGKRISSQVIQHNDTFSIGRNDGMFYLA